MALFPPLWLYTAQDQDIDVRPIIVMREQNAIVRSLARRNRMSPEHARDLLVRYGEGVDEWYARETSYSIHVHFEDLIEDPRGVLRSIIKELRIPAPSSAAFLTAVDFIDEGLVHG